MCGVREGERERQGHTHRGRTETGKDVGAWGQRQETIRLGRQGPGTEVGETGATTGTEAGNDKEGQGRG